MNKKQKLIPNRALTADIENSIMLGMSVGLKEILKDTEIHLLRAALGQAKGNISQASRILKINRSTLHEKMRRYKM